MQPTWWGLWQPLGAQSSDDRALSRQVEHQYRVEPEGDAKSEGTQDFQEAAQGRLAVLDIDLEDKGKKMHAAYHTEPLKSRRHIVYWVSSLVEASRRGFANRLPWRA